MQRAIPAQMAAVRKAGEVEDLCDACVAKLRKLLEESGIRINEVDVDW